MQRVTPVLLLLLSLSGAGGLHSAEKKERTAIVLAREQLELFAGTYELGSGMELVVTLEGNQLSVESTDGRKIPIFPESETSFFPKVGDLQLDFLKDAQGAVTHVVMHAGGRDAKASRRPKDYVDPARKPTHADVTYATVSAKQKLDLYLPASSAPAPLIIWIHGGGFFAGDKRSMPRRDFGPAPKPTGPSGPYQIQVPDVDLLVAKGYAVASLNYRLGVPVRDAALKAGQDAKAAVRFLRANATKYELDPVKFAVWGNSAGGYVAAMLGVTGDQTTVFDDFALGNPEVSSAVQAVVAWYGALQQTDQLSLYPYLAKARGVPPFLFAHGTADQAVPAIASQRLHDALKAAGKISTLNLLPNAGHEDPAFMATQIQPALQFINRTFGRAD